ncbi:MAG TPA: YlxR family protein [Clostridia bacterium]|nr:YlxR family protein [Clostridia bacterium]
MIQKKVPLRMCVGCRQMRPKKELLRIVRTPEGEVKADRTGRASGRGAYICKNIECLEKAKKIRALERALEHAVDSEVFERLKEEVALADG